MNNAILKVDHLTAYLGSEDNPIRAVDGISFEIKRGQTLALLGESGCGKSMSALALMRLLPASGRIVSGTVQFGGRDLLKLSEAGMRGIRGAGISMIFQEPMTSLNPVIKVGQQIVESLRAHQSLQGKAAAMEAMALLDAVGIADPKLAFHRYPHQISGGMKQRVVIAMALANAPQLLIADEPTTALDVTIQAQVLDLIRDLQAKRSMAVLLITHDLGVVNELADKVAVMYAGQIVEIAGRESFFTRPLHPYSEKLFHSIPGISKRNRVLDVIQGMVPSLQTRFEGCRFVSRCHRALDVCAEHRPVWSDCEDVSVFCHLYASGDSEQGSVGQAAVEAEGSTDIIGRDNDLLQVDDLKVHFPITAGVFKRVVGSVRAVDGVDMEIPKGRTLALVGESGCGKTTTGKGILQLIRPSAGRVLFEGVDLVQEGSASLRSRRSDFQIIFQDPYASMNPRMLVGDIVAEGLGTLNGEMTTASRQDYVYKLLQQVGLPSDSAGRYPHEFSGGQRQRISIARAIAVRPKLLVCDEPTSALDLSVQAQILNLLKRLQQQMNISYLFITHNISVVAYLAHFVAVMYLGRIVEYGPAEQVLVAPQHPYTRALLSAVPTVDNESQRHLIHLSGDVPSPASPPPGCFFHPRCAYAETVCRHTYPPVSEVADNHVASCYLYDEQSE